MNSKTEPDGEPPGEVTRILREISTGDESHMERLLEIVYATLRKLASSFLAREQPGHTLQPTALVHEAYMSLVSQDNVNWQNQAHFMAIVAQAMRRILIDHGRAKKRVKRGGGWDRVELNSKIIGADSAEQLDLVLLDKVLEQFRESHPRPSQVVEMRVFAGLEMSEIASALEVAVRTVERDLRFARAWISDAIDSASS